MATDKYETIYAGSISADTVIMTADQITAYVNNKIDPIDEKLTTILTK